MKKVVTLLAVCTLLGACHCTKCTKNSCKKAVAPVKQVVQQPVRPTPAPAPAPAPAPKVQEQDFAAVAQVKQAAQDKLVLTYKEPINFAHNSDVIQSNSINQIKQTAAALKKYPNATVRVAGYTDSLGDANYNIDLSERRAKAVAMELVKEGVPAKNVSFIGYGKANPVATNKTAAGRAQNRRVELEISNN